MSDQDDSVNKSDAPSSYGGIARRFQRIRDIEKALPPQAAAPEQQPAKLTLDHPKVPTLIAHQPVQSPEPRIYTQQPAGPRVFGNSAPPSVPRLLLIYGSIFKVLGIGAAILFVWAAKALDSISRLGWLQTLIFLIGLAFLSGVYFIGRGLCTASRSAVVGLLGLFLLCLILLACRVLAYRSLGLDSSGLAIFALLYVPPLLCGFGNWRDLT